MLILYEENDVSDCMGFKGIGVEVGKSQDGGAFYQGIKEFEWI